MRQSAPTEVDGLRIAVMVRTNKAKAAGVSAGSFLELRAQVAKQKESLAKGDTTAIVGKKKEGKVRLSSFILHVSSRDEFPLLTEAEQMGTATQSRSEPRCSRL